MARNLNRLSARKVETLRRPGRHADGGGLYLSISPTGHRRWVFMYKRGARQTESGVHPDRARGLAPLADARSSAARFREMLEQGLDPKMSKRPTATMTFADCVREAMKIKPWRHWKTPLQWRMTLTDYCASIQDVPIGEVTKEHIVACLMPLGEMRPRTAENLRGRIEFVVAWATAKGHRKGDNPARWKNCLEFELSKPKSSDKHHAAMDWRNVPSFVSRLRERENVTIQVLEYNASLRAALVLEFLILTAT